MPFQKGHPHRFKKGQSGNPGGRPKELEDIQAAAREHTTEAMAVLVGGLASDDPRVSVVCAKEILDRGWGRAAATLEIRRHPLDGLTHAQLVRLLGAIDAAAKSGPPQIGGPEAIAGEARRVPTVQ